MSEEEQINFKSAAELLSKAHYYCNLSEQTLLQHPEVESEVSSIILKSWTWLAYYHQYLKADELPVTAQKLPANPVEISKYLNTDSVKLPASLTQDLWNEQLHLLFECASSLNYSSELLDQQLLQTHIDILRSYIKKEWQQCYKQFGIKPPLKKISMLMGSILVVVLAIAGIRELTRSKGPWRIAYFNNPKLQGSPLEIAETDEINYDWTWNAPITELGSDNYSARFDVCLKLTKAADVKVQLGSDDGSRLFVNKEKIIDKWRPSAYTIESATKRLEAGTHHMRTDFFQLGGGSQLTQKILIDGKPIAQQTHASLKFPEAKEQLAVFCK